MEEQQHHQSAYFSQLHNICIIKVHAGAEDKIANSPVAWRFLQIKSEVLKHT